MPYRDDVDRCKSSIRWLRQEIAECQRAARRLPSLRKKLQGWELRLKQKRTPSGNFDAKAFKGRKAVVRLEAAKNFLRAYGITWYCDRSSMSPTARPLKPTWWSLKPKVGLTRFQEQVLNALGRRNETEGFHPRFGHKWVTVRWIFED